MDAAATDDLLQELGGPSALDEIVQDFYARLVADDDLGPVFAGVDVARLVHMQEEFLAAAFGTPDHVADADLRSAHARRHISTRQFSRFVELFLDTLVARGVAAPVLDRVAERLALYVDDVGRGVRRLRLIDRWREAHIRRAPRRVDTSNAPSASSSSECSAIPWSAIRPRSRCA